MEDAMGAYFMMFATTALGLPLPLPDLGYFIFSLRAVSLFRYPRDPQLVSVAKEEKPGHAYTEVILKNPMFREMENAAVYSAMRVIADRLKDHLSNSDYPYRFIVFKNKMINAFT